MYLIVKSWQNIKYLFTAKFQSHNIKVTHLSTEHRLLVIYKEPPVWTLVSFRVSRNTIAKITRVRPYKDLQIKINPSNGAQKQISD